MAKDLATVAAVVLAHQKAEFAFALVTHRVVLPRGRFGVRDQRGVAQRDGTQQDEVLDLQGVCVNVKSNKRSGQLRGKFALNFAGDSKNQLQKTCSDL